MGCPMGPDNDRGDSAIWHRWKFLQQCSICGRQTAGPAVDQIGTVTKCTVQPLSTPPTFDPGVVARTKDVRNAPTTELGWTRELGLLEQSGVTEALGDGTDRIAHRPVEQARHRLDDETGCDLSPAEHHVADADLAITEMLAYPMVDPLVPSAQQAEARVRTIGIGQRGEFRRKRLVESAATGAQKKQRPRWIGFLDGVDARSG